MKSRGKTLDVFSMSALDLFASALGAFILVAVILFPYYRHLSKHKLPHTDVVIVLDTTGSMEGVTESLKREIRGFADITRKLAPSLAVGVVVFNDADEIPDAEVYFSLREINKDNYAMEELEKRIARIQAGKAGGSNSNTGENLLGGLRLAMQTGWRTTSDLRVIVVVTDDIPHEGTEDLVIATAHGHNCGNCLLLAVHALTGKDPEYAKYVGDFLARMAAYGKGRYYETTSSLMTPILGGMLDHLE